MTLTTNQINALKTAIAERENRLDIDICDAEVFDYLKDMEDMEIQASVTFLNQQAAIQDNFDECKWRNPRTRLQIAMDMIDAIINGNDLHAAFAAI